MTNFFEKKKYEIIVFSDDWHGLPFSCKHLLKHFLPEIPLIWVETIGLRSPSFNWYDIKRAWQKIAGWFSSGKNDNSSLPPNLRLIDPFLIPYNQYKIVRFFNKNQLVRAIKNLTKNDEPKIRVMLTTWPFLGSLVGSLGEDLSVYYRVDDFSEFPGVSKELIISEEAKIIDKADIVVGSATRLSNLESNKKTGKYLPHGVDYEHFSSKKSHFTSANLFLDIASPIIGFFGLLNSWLDLDLVYRVAQKRPDWSFLFLGPSQLASDQLPVAPNIKFLGPVDYDDLPSYAAHFDAALIPFKINKLTEAVNPLKLMEYLALGLPVISTPLPEVVRFSRHVYIGSDPDSFLNEIERALYENNPSLVEERLAVAKDHSWLAQSHKLRNWIEEALEGKIDN